jgi:CspA family cold shock protein
MSKVEIGKVKFFDANRGFGFIARDNGGLDIFVHVNNLPYGVTLHEGQKVEFEVHEFPGGRMQVEWTLRREPTDPEVVRRCLNFVIDTAIRLEALA